jgi:membrane-associated phospholipid phosphatase
VLLTDLLNVRLGVELLTGAVIAAAVFITRQPRSFFADWWFLLVGLVMWNLSGPIAAASPFPLHLEPMLAIDRWLGLGQQPVAVVQHRLAGGGQVGPLDVATAVTYNMHLAEPYIAGYFLWRLDPLVYLRFAASVLILLVVGFLTFIVFPAIPPWLSSQWYGTPPDVVNRFGLALRAHPLPLHGTPIFYVFKLAGDRVAAFPSEHAAFPLLELLAFWGALGRRAWPLALWVVAVAFAVVYLGEHWITDVLAGYAYALSIWWAVGAALPIQHAARRGGRPAPVSASSAQSSR